MSKQFKPMLSATYKQEGDIKFPCLASPKLDGIRCLIIDGVAVSRTLKPIPNKYVQKLFGKEELNGLDGELIVGSPTDHNCMQNTSSGVMSIEGEPDVKFYVFDDFTRPNEPFDWRYTTLDIPLKDDGRRIIKVMHGVLENQRQLDKYENGITSAGYEGIMCRNPNSPYKYGRSTIKEGGLIKVKRFSDSEGVIIGFEEKMHNANEAEVDNLGHSKRSLKQEGMVGTDTLGVLILKDPAWNEPVRVGSGFTDAQRAEIWNNQEKYLGKMWKYKFFNHGVKDAPRHAVSLGERYLEDM